MTRYVIHINGVRTPHEFDSMTEAELYALENNLCRYTIALEAPKPPPVEHDLGGES